MHALVCICVSFCAGVSFCSTSSFCRKSWESHYLLSHRIWVFIFNQVYWTSQLLTWLLLPMTEATMSAGDFTLWAKIKSALKEQVVVYASLLVVGIGVYLYLTFHEGMKQGQLKQTAMMASNMWGLFMVILLLGYGLVDVPRRLWRGTTTEYELRSMQFRASKLYSEIADATGAGEDVEDEIKTVASQISAGEPLRKYVDIILAQSQSAASYSDYTPGSTEDLVTQTSLTKLNKRLMKSRRVLNRCQCQWNALMDEIFDMEDVIKNSSTTDRVFRAAFGPVTPSHPHFFPSLLTREDTGGALPMICPLESAARYLSDPFYADVRLHIPMTRNVLMTQAATEVPKRDLVVASSGPAVDGSVLGGACHHHVVVALVVRDFVSINRACAEHLRTDGAARRCQLELRWVGVCYLCHPALPLPLHLFAHLSDPTF